MNSLVTPLESQASAGTFHRAWGLRALLAGTLPFVFGRLLWNVTPGGDVAGPSLSPHILLRVTGIPEPFCGATRAFILAAHGDMRFMDYNPVWAFVGLALAGWGLLLLLRSLSGRLVLDPWSMRVGRWIAQRPVRALVPVTPVVLTAWAVALLHAAAIRGA